MKKVWGKLEGSKTYIVSTVVIVYAIVVAGWQMGDWNTASQLILGALGLGAVRHAI